MLRVILGCVALCVGSAATARSADVSYPSGEITLGAELMLPEKRASRSPAVVIIQGSGTSDRSNAWARVIADTFVENGVAVLLTDKRGSGKSAGNWRTSGFHELADDALAGVRFLRSRQEIDPTRIGLAGLSQGGRVAPIAAAKSQEVAFVVSLVTDAVTFPEQSFVEMANTARQAGLDPEAVSQVLQLNSAAGRYLTGGPWQDYADLRGKMLQGPAASIAEGFPAESTAPIWGFLRKVFTFDPIPYWTSMGQPSLLIFGGEDERDNVPVAESVRRLQFAFAAAEKRNVELVVLPGIGHSLMSQPGTLAPSFKSALSTWLRGQVVNQRKH